MSKLGYFFAGVMAGATALTAAAFLVDDVANRLDTTSDENSEQEQVGDDAPTEETATGEGINPTA